MGDGSLIGVVGFVAVNVVAVVNEMVDVVGLAVVVVDVAVVVEGKLAVVVVIVVAVTVVVGLVAAVGVVVVTIAIRGVVEVVVGVGGEVLSTVKVLVTFANCKFEAAGTSYGQIWPFLFILEKPCCRSWTSSIFIISRCIFQE